MNLPRVLGDSMYLMFMRHGEAEEKKPGISDEERHLTDKGREDVQLVAKLIPVKPEAVYSSPLVRAVETAEIVAATHEATLKVVDELHPKLISLEAIAKLGIKGNAVLVGHAPSINKVISELIGGGLIKLKAGAVAGVEVSEIKKGGGVLRFIITPEVARVCFE